MTGRTAIGWPVLDPEQLTTCRVPVQGGEVTLHVRPGDTCEILMDLVRRYDATVEPLVGPWEPDFWTYAKRRVRESSDIWSEHSGGTAVDCRSTKHPRGVRGTFTLQQRAAIESLLDFYDGVIAWGGHFHTVVDEMHFEITVPPGSPLIAATARKVRDVRQHEEENDDVKPKIVTVRGETPQRKWLVYPSGLVAYLEDGDTASETAAFWGITGEPVEISQRVFAQFQRVKPD